jgi:hypothetical protein
MKRLFPFLVILFSVCHTQGQDTFNLRLNNESATVSSNVIELADGYFLTGFSIRYSENQSFQEFYAQRISYSGEVLSTEYFGNDTRGLLTLGC